MRKIKELIITLVSIFLIIPMVCRIVLFFNPDNTLAETIVELLSLIWIGFKELELQDLFRDIGMFLVIAGILTGFGSHVTRKNEARIWAIVSFIGAAIALVTRKLI